MQGRCGWAWGCYQAVGVGEHQSSEPTGHYLPLFHLDGRGFLGVSPHQVAQWGSRKEWPVVCEWCLLPSHGAGDKWGGLSTCPSAQHRTGVPQYLKSE